MDAVPAIITLVPKGLTSGTAPAHKGRAMKTGIRSFSISFLLLTLFMNLSGCTESQREQVAPGQASSREAPVSKVRSNATAPSDPKSKSTSNPLMLAESGTTAERESPRDDLFAATGTRKLGNIRALTRAGAGSYTAPRFEGNGEGLLVTATDGPRIYRLPLAGGNPELVNDSSLQRSMFEDRGEDASGNPVFAPRTASARSVDELEANGSTTGAFVRADTVIIRKKAGEAPQELVLPRDRYTEAALSPDGRTVVCVGESTGISLVPVEGGKSIGLGEGRLVQWLPDGSGVVFLRTRMDEKGNTSGADIFLADSTSGKLSNLTGNSAVVERFPSVSPDSAKIAWETGGIIYMGDLQ